MSEETKSLLRTALEGFIESLDREQRVLRAKLDLGVDVITQEFPGWTVDQSSGYMAALKARRDTLNVTVYRLRRLLDQVGYQ